MPKYDYKCPSCGVIEEYEHSIKEEPVLECGKCFVQVRKVFSATSAVFKGGGWGKVYGTHKPKGNGLD